MPAAGLLGISASWLPPADLMVRQKAKLTEQPLKNDWKEALFYLLVLLFALRLPDDLQGIGLFGSYFALFVLAAKSSQTFNNLPKRPLMQRNQLFNKQFLLYFFFFLLLFGLRAARLIKSNALFEWAITGFLFLFALLLITLTKRSRWWKQPLHLNVLTFIRGVIGNFLFLFGSVYVTGRFGAQALSTHVYLPYALGLFGAMFLGGKLAHRLEKQLVPTYLLGLMAGVLLFSSDTLIPISLFVISFFNAGLNQSPVTLSVTAAWMASPHSRSPRETEYESSIFFPPAFSRPDRRTASPAGPRCTPPPLSCCLRSAGAFPPRR